MREFFVGETPELRGETVPPPRIGVDVVGMARIERALRHGLAARLCPPDSSGMAEQLAAGGPASGEVAAGHAAVSWGVKEAAIKVAGGRPPGFDWRHIGLLDLPPDKLEVATWLGRCASDTICAPPNGSCCYVWPEAGEGRVQGTAVWVRADGILTIVAMGHPSSAATEKGSHCEALH